jgi:hypothetical protein
MTYQEGPVLAESSATGQLVVPDEKVWVPKQKPTLRLQPFEAAFFSAWHVYSGNGVFNIKYEDGSMNVNSNVVVSISEMTTNDTPFIGNAPMSVANVAPFNNGTWVKVNIGWDKPLRFQLMFVWGNT